MLKKNGVQKYAPNLHFLFLSKFHLGSKQNCQKHGKNNLERNPIRPIHNFKHKVAYIHTEFLGCGHNLGMGALRESLSELLMECVSIGEVGEMNLGNKHAQKVDEQWNVNLLKSLID